jgi:hypothetical protein
VADCSERSMKPIRYQQDTVGLFFECRIGNLDPVLRPQIGSSFRMGTYGWALHGLVCGITATNRIHLVLFGMQNRTFGPIWQPLIRSAFQ